MSFRIRQERLWTTYHRLVISDEYSLLWRTFFRENSGTDADPTVYQYIGDAIMKENEMSSSGYN